jgi:hypothetical protein
VTCRRRSDWRRAIPHNSRRRSQAQASGLSALGLSEDEIGISIGRTSRAVHDYFDAVKAGAAAEVALLRELDAQNKLQVDAENATIRLSLAIEEHLLT